MPAKHTDPTPSHAADRARWAERRGSRASISEAGFEVHRGGTRVEVDLGPVRGLAVRECRAHPGKVANPAESPKISTDPFTTSTVTVPPFGRSHDFD
ncbi:hypothetical protein Q0Z83_036020 [Actinoplanes sichuanensis]|nr:hypothetical protein Q0Z83_036020 [Actinoplanes sichuanensis]